MKYSHIECLQPFNCFYCNRSWHVFTDYQHHMQRHRSKVNCHLLKPKWRRSFTGTDAKSSARARTTAFITDFNKSNSFIDVVDGKRRYRCEICSKICQNAGAFKNHCWVHPEYRWIRTINQEKLRCHYTGLPEKIRDQRSWKKTVTKLYICPHCGRDLHIEHSLLRHVALHYARASLTDCLYCPVKFDRAEELRYHMRSFHGLGDEFKNNVANKTRKTSQSGSCDDRPMTGSEKFKCDICGKQTRDRSDLKRHIFRNHSDTTSAEYKCKLCGKQTIDDLGLKRHMARYHHNAKRRKNTEVDNDKQDADIDSRTSCLSPKWFVCKVCGDKCPSKSELKRHSLIHTDVRPYQCRHCDLRYKRTGDRNRHERSHTGVHLMSCKFCGRGSRDMHTLRKHEKTHTKAKPYRRNMGVNIECELCGVKCTSKAAMVRHSLIHSDG